MRRWPLMRSSTIPQSGNNATFNMYIYIYNLFKTTLLLYYETKYTESLNLPKGMIVYYELQNSPISFLDI